jgi:predicted Rossmann fold flavoprotein
VTGPRYDAVVIGAGAAGLFCAARAGQRGVRVLLLDHAPKLAEKIRISGGGRCNFTNRDVGAANFFSANPDFCRSALARYTPRDFIALVERHGIAWHEKHRGQLFCDGSSRQIIELLERECAQGRVERRQPCAVGTVEAADGGFRLETAHGAVGTAQVVVATGGLSIPQLGASDFGYRLARRFGLRVIEPRPALVPLTFDAAHWQPWSGLAGVSMPAAVETGSGRERVRFEDDLLFTHRGLSGPAILQISTLWRAGEPVRVGMAPGTDLARHLLDAKASGARSVPAALAVHVPRRFADTWLAASGRADAAADRPLADCRDRDLTTMARELGAWTLVPDGTEGFRKAEVTAGGVDTRELDSRTFESRRRPGLYFIGEVVDVTGWLGGYNFQWAWASAAACAEALGCGDLAAGL